MVLHVVMHVMAMHVMMHVMHVMHVMHARRWLSCRCVGIYGIPKEVTGVLVWIVGSGGNMGPG
jgi:hypothetical protein